MIWEYIWVNDFWHDGKRTREGDGHTFADNLNKHALKGWQLVWADLPERVALMKRTVEKPKPEHFGASPDRS